LGIKKAEHDALKRAAVKFGIARELYKKEFDALDGKDHSNQPTSHNGASRPVQQGNFQPVAPSSISNPVSQTLADMLSDKQLGAIRAFAKAAHTDADEECAKLFNCQVAELSKRAASALIDHLKNLKG
jgi:hypothetical protein